MFFLTWIFAILPVVCNSLAAQPVKDHVEFGCYPFKKLGKKEGLSQVWVTAMVTDARDRMWVGTNHGLNWFDGKRFNPVYSVPGDTTSLSNNFITCLASAGSHHLWVGTQDGLNLFDTRTFTCHRVGLDTTAKLRTVSAIIPLDSARCLVNWNRQISVVTTTGMVIADYRVKKYQNARLYQSLDGDVFFRQDHNHWRVRVSDSSLVLEAPEKVHPTYRVVSDGLKVTDNQLFYPGANGIDSLSLSVRLRTSSISRDTAGTLWFATSQGLLAIQYEPGSRPGLKYYMQCAKNLPPEENNFNQVYADHSGLIWTVNTNNGLRVLTPMGRGIRQYGLAQLNGATQVWGIDDRYGHVLLATNKGVLSKATPCDSFQLFFTPNHNREERVTTVYLDSTGACWYNNNSGLGYRDDKGMQVFFVLPESLRVNLDAHIAFRVLDISTGESVILSSNGLLTPGANRTLGYWLDPDKYPFVRHYTMNAAESEGHMWFTTNKALVDFDINTGTYKEYSPQSHPELWRNKGLPAGVVPFGPDSCMVYYINSPPLWLSGEPVQVSFSETTFYEHLYWKDYLIFLHGNGVSFYRPLSGTVQYVPIPGHGDLTELNQGCMALNGNKLWVGGMKGLLEINIPVCLKSGIPGTIQLSTLSVNYTPRSFINYASNGVLQFPSETRAISFQVGVNNHFFLSGIQYRYKLVPQDSRWIQLSNPDQPITYTNLPPGKYQLFVEASAGGKTSEQVFDMVRESALWETLWFRGVLVLLAAVLLAWAVRWYLRLKFKREQLQWEAEQKLRLEKEQISRELHDHIGAHLAYIASSVDHLSITQSQSPNRKWKQDLLEIGRFTRETLKQLRQTVHVLQGKNASVEQLHGFIQLQVQQLQSVGRQTSYTCDVDGVLPLYPATFRQVQAMVMEIISNILKHAGACAVDIRMTGDAHGEIELCIRDHGKGFDVSRSADCGNGLKNLHYRSNEINGRLLVRSAPGEGTEIRCFFPLT